MSAEESPDSAERDISTRAFHAMYLVAIGVAMVGWACFLGYFALALLGY